MGGVEFCKVDRGSAMEALVGRREQDFEFNPVLDRKPVDGFEDGCDVVVLPHPHQDPGSTFLDVPLVVEPGGDKGVGKFFGVRQSDCGAEYFF